AGSPGWPPSTWPAARWPPSSAEAQVRPRVSFRSATCCCFPPVDAAHGPFRRTVTPRALQWRHSSERGPGRHAPARAHRATAMGRLPTLLCLCSLLLLVTGTRAGPPNATNADEETLKAVGLGTDDAALLDFFRRRTPDEGDRDTIAALIRDLGADD